MFPSTHYQHSGKAPLSGVLLILVGGPIAGAILGAIYGFLIYWSPFVYINAFITFGFGALLAVAIGSLGKIGKIRNATVLTVLALLVSLLAYYVHWVVWTGRMMETQVVAPDELWVIISSINILGPWSIFGWTPTGFSLWAIWGIEAILIVGIGAVSAHGVIDIPYCEKTQQWTTETVLAEHFEPIDENATVETPSSLLQTLKPTAEATDAYTEVSVATAEGSDLRCVSLSTVNVETDKDGKEETKKTDFVRHMLFDRDSFDRLMRFSQLSAG